MNWSLPIPASVQVASGGRYSDSCSPFWGSFGGRGAFSENTRTVIDIQQLHLRSLPLSVCHEAAPASRAAGRSADLRRRIAAPHRPRLEPLCTKPCNIRHRQLGNIRRLFVSGGTKRQSLEGTGDPRSDGRWPKRFPVICASFSQPRMCSRGCLRQSSNTCNPSRCTALAFGACPCGVTAPSEIPRSQRRGGYLGLSDGIRRCPEPVTCVDPRKCGIFEGE